MSAVPTYRDLEAAGHDAGALLDACESELERAIPAAASKGDRTALADDLKRVRQLRTDYFGGEA